MERVMGAAQGRVKEAQAVACSNNSSTQHIKPQDMQSTWSSYTLQRAAG
jgi:hypothetical protein